MAKVDLNTHREELLRVHKEVSNPNNATDWQVFQVFTELSQYVLFPTFCRVAKMTWVGFDVNGITSAKKAAKLNSPQAINRKTQGQGPKVMMTDKSYGITQLYESVWFAYFI